MYLVFLLELLGSKLNDANVGQAGGDFVNGKDVLPPVQKFGSDVRRQVPDQVVLSNGMAQVILEPGHGNRHVDQHDKEG